MHLKKLVIFFLLPLFFFPDLWAQENIRETEYLLKSVNLFKICQFTIWPQEKAENSPFYIFVLGRNPQGQRISVPADKKINGRRVEIKDIKEVGEVGAGEVLFICSSEESKIDSILASIKSRQILTAADTKGFAEKGVMINFYIELETVKFEINRQAIRHAGLKLYPQIYSLGKNVN
ncbi:MAG: YfiR family protein [Chrysiogenia bacterium]